MCKGKGRETDVAHHRLMSRVPKADGLSQPLGSGGILLTNGPHQSCGSSGGAPAMAAAVSIDCMRFNDTASSRWPASSRGVFLPSSLYQGRRRIWSSLVAAGAPSGSGSADS